MPVNTYEGMFLLDSAKAAVNWDEAVASVHTILTRHNAEIVASRQWDERRLAYPVNGHKKGTYLLTYFKADGAQLKDIESDCRLSDLVLRDLILKVHPKLAEHMITSAMASTPGAEEGEDGARPGDDDDRPRRRRRED
jgi:small subunit ribosomal protein S6